MKFLLATLIASVMMLVGLTAAQNPPQSTSAKAPQASGAANSAELDAILTRMDETAAKFKSAEADFVWDVYEKVVNETDTQKGKMYFRRTKSGVEMAADITQPTPKYVVFTDSTVRVYEPNLDRVTNYDTRKNKADFESFLVLGFGGRGHDLLKSFDVRYLGTEDVQGIKTAKLELVPKSAKVRNTFSQILLWINPTDGLSLQQKFIDPAGNYRLVKYSNIQINVKIPDSVFKLKTRSNTKVVSP